MRNIIKLSAICLTVFSLSSLSVQAEEIYEDTFIPKTQQNICIEYGDRYDISAELLEALIEIESSGRMSAQNGSCVGICQINTAVWGDDYDTECKQVNKACQILLGYLRECPDISYALMRYNGDSNAKQYYEDGEMSRYAKWVLERTYELEEVHGKHDY